MVLFTWAKWVLGLEYSNLTFEINVSLDRTPGEMRVGDSYIYSVTDTLYTLSFFLITLENLIHQTRRACGQLPYAERLQLCDDCNGVCSVKCIFCYSLVIRISL